MATRIIGYEFTVTGEGQFPTDMLRYDHCYPRSSEDAVHLPLSVYEFARDRRQPRSVTLMTNLRPPTIERWQSFGWAVSDVKVVR